MFFLFFQILTDTLANGQPKHQLQLLLLKKKKKKKKKHLKPEVFHFKTISGSSLLWSGDFCKTAHLTTGGSVSCSLTAGRLPPP